MRGRNLEQIVQEADSIVELLRRNGAIYTADFPVVPNEYTNWIDEQRAITEAAALGDLSHHMEPIHFEGPDCLDLFSDLCVNDFSDFEVGRAKQVVICNHHGHIMGDGPLLRLDRHEFWGVPTCSNWVKYTIETGDYDVEAEFDPVTPMQDGMPATFIFQVQGPEAVPILEQLTDAPLDEIDFYSFREATLDGRDVRIFGHGMNTEPGFEIHGSYDDADDIRSAIVDAGEAHGLRQLGSKAYLTQSVRLGWILPGPPPIYDVAEMEGFRKWLGPRTWEATYSIEGSYDSDDIRDYYMTPVELGYEHLIDFDHEFVGREALRQAVDDPKRTLVSLHWNDEDVVDVYASLFRDGETNKLMDLPRFGWARAAFDEVRIDGAVVGISGPRSYQWDVRSIVSLCRLDVEHAEPGTDVTVTWGEGPGSPNPNVEAHVQREIRATVQPVPYTEDKRKIAAD